ncbi:uncharacterized protein G2W53_021515 [Senna tora]|uniref:Uncharacterized protein n=1 Tax=Senna tora TaxID=362788 RepID=A0A834WL70_9FABA|nr:uncharacterized protein G2W53_021515 [Senna tora]
MASQITLRNRTQHKEMSSRIHYYYSQYSHLWIKSKKIKTIRIPKRYKL